MVLLSLKTAYRSLIKRKGYAALNIFGLALGMTSCLLIFKYVAYERSYDRFQQKNGQLYRIQLEDYQNGVLAFKEATNYAALAPALKRDFPEVEEATRFFKTHMLLSNEEKNIRFNENSIYYAESSFLDLFDIHLLEGDAKSALRGPGKIVISENMAGKYFGKVRALGKILRWRNEGSIIPLIVTGVCQDYPLNSHLHFSALVSYNSFSEINGTLGTKDDPIENSWYWTDFYTYIRLKPGVDWRKLQAKLPGFAELHVNKLRDYVINHDQSVFQMIPVADIHLYSHYTEETEANGDGKSVSFLFLIGFFILGIAWINYVNMATARSLERAREVGVRKLLGAVRYNLIAQFMMESFMINVLAFLIALILSFLLTKPFMLITGRPLGDFFYLPGHFALIFGLVFISGSFISGIYPAFILSGYHPATVLKGLFKNSRKGLWIRKGLIIGQFASTILMISGTIIIYRQVQFMRKQNLGVDIGRTIVLSGANSIPDSAFQTVYRPFKNDVMRVPGVSRMMASSNVMGEEILWSTNWKSLHDRKQGAVNLFHMGIDYDFVPGFGLHIVAGRNFSRDFPNDQNAAILNVSAVRALGFHNPGEALHETIISVNSDTLQVTGVIADFHQEGLQKEITPLIFFLNRRARYAYSIKIDPSKAAVTVASVRKIWDLYFPSDPFNYFFLDDFFSRQYEEDKRFGDIFGLFSFLAIVIACLGLLALSTYNILQRTREIGIRKVLGANLRDLIFVLSKDFLFLIFIAFVLAIPVSIWLMQHWLESFAYRIQISWWIYALAGSLSFLIALLTISFQAIKAALGNPADSLRTE